MDTFTFGTGRGWLDRLFGRSPLVRGSDRVEAVVLLLAMVAVLVAVPIAGAVGTAVYSSRSAVYQEQARVRYAVTATVVQDSTVTVRPYSVIVAVHARWQDHGRTHDGTFGWDRAAKVGEHLPIWVDDKGDYAGPPAPPKRAAADAVAAGTVMWLAVVAVTGTLIALVRFRLDRHRHDGWDRGLRSLVGDGGGRTSSEP
jgi:hypothetical protein